MIDRLMTFRIVRCLAFGLRVKRRQYGLERFRQSPYIGFLAHGVVATRDVVNLQPAARNGLPAQSRVPASGPRLLEFQRPHQRDLPWIKLDGVTP